MIIALFPNATKQHSRNLAVGIREFLSSHGVTVVAEEEEAAAIGAHPLSAVQLSEIDFMISMGGDGTILRILHKYPDLHAAVLGINLGHLGFMADIPIDDLYPSLQDLLSGAYKIEERLTIQGHSEGQESCFAVNDIVVHRAQNPSLVEIGIHVDGLYLNTFEADGVIVATPNGSTAYSLAAGGPIISPDLDALVITPISPHTISNRPIVLSANQTIQIQYLSEYEPVEIRVDGIGYQSLRTGDVFRVGACKRRFKLVSLHKRRDYFSTLRSKLNWSGRLR